jgi:NitT/TauT family transport system ATP-binding protein
LDGRTLTEAAYMLARDALLPWRNACENVEFGLEVRGVPAKARRAIALDWLERVGLGNYAGAHVEQLSQGMRQRVAIARTLALAPRLLLMDEPFAALDAQTRVLLQEEFLRLWEATRSTVLFITHDLAEAIKLSDRVILLGGSPTRITSDLRIELPRPRPSDVEHDDPRFADYYNSLWMALREDVNRAAIKNYVSKGGPAHGLQPGR